MTPADFQPGGMDWRRQLEAIVAPAVARSSNIDAIRVGRGVLAETPALFARHFGVRGAYVVADGNTWFAAGEAVAAAFAEAGHGLAHHVLEPRPRPKPTVELGDELAARIGATDAIPVVVGSGVLNDLVKYAAYRLGRPYLCVATAASMDGYASGGAPLAEAGFKKTIPCRPARVVVADLNVIAAAPPEMTGWGFGDLAGKMPAGGDWLIADALGVEPLDDVAWPLVQDNLRTWLATPAAVAAGEPGAVAALFAGLTVAGLAMEFHGSSRPASGADHQIAHLWEMEGLIVAGEPAAHGACVAVGCHTVLALFDWLVRQDLGALDVEAVVARAPSLAAKAAAVDRLFPPALAERAEAETAAKHLDAAAHRARLETVRAVWPRLRDRLAAHLMGADEMAELLHAAGAPVRAAELGVTPAHLRRTVAASRFIRSRYTVLDLLDECGLLEAALDAVFARPAFAGGA
jgi:glycerol-1-phosphate dehydrogenase [NAD(P)+]